MILFINACARKESRTLRLARALEEKIDPLGTVEEVDLYNFELPPLDQDRIYMRDRALAENDFSDVYFDTSKQFAKADDIIIAAPYWDLSFPAVLKQYLETVSVNGIAFRYTQEGDPEGLCRAKRLYYVMTAGGEVGNFNLGYDYVKALTMGLFGVKRTWCVRAVGLDIIGVDAEAVMQNAISNLGMIV